MTFLGYVITVVCSCFLYTLPRQWAIMPMLVGATYMPAGQQVELAGLHFTVTRILCMAGLLRVMLRRERIAGGWQTMDRLVLVWCVWLVFSGLFHKEIVSTLVYRVGYVFDSGIIYFLFRVFMRDVDEVLQSCKIIILLLVPVALLLVVEKMKGFNCFSLLGIPAEAGMRDGKIRAQGPFAHSILAGTVGAVCLPLAILFWSRDRRLVLVGVVASAAMVYASASSGPIMTTLTIVFGLALWWVRGQMRAVRWGAVALVFVLSLTMQAPVYYLLAKIDLTGSSTGWHRAYLIETSIKHLGEWWLVGTDYTRHWISYGVAWSGNHIDITNHYIQMGVLGGLPLMLLFMAVIASGFAAVGAGVRRNRHALIERQFLIWTLGAILFGHATTFLSISYFDQTIVFFQFLLAAIASLQVTALKTAHVPGWVPDKNTSSLPPEHERNFCYHC